MALSVLPWINNMNDIFLPRLHWLLDSMSPLRKLSSPLTRANLYIGWNSVGWQSLVLLLFSGVTGLEGDWTPKSKLKCTLLGLESIVVINFTRIVAIALVLLKWGPSSAVMFHDHLSQLLTFI